VTETSSWHVTLTTMPAVPVSPTPTHRDVRCGNGGASCVEVADYDGMTLVRDTKDHGRGPVHRRTPDEWRAFVASVRNGEFG
jgi:hypothetical protein